MNENIIKQSSAFLSTYTADVSGVCSALYELDGMVIMHDASGCNSTYNTHDEPRWYQMDSMIYISALTELDALLGNDDKLVEDICKAAEELKPRFIAVCGTPIPMVIGTDFYGIAKMIEKRTGIPTFGFPTNGMHSYLSGIDISLQAFAKRFCKKHSVTEPDEQAHQLTCHEFKALANQFTRQEIKPSVNLLGVTPLDFSITGNVEAMKSLFECNGYHINSCFAMGCTFEELIGAGAAGVNVVVSSCGISTARYLEAECGIPYVVGIPMGDSLTKAIFSSIEQAACDKANQYPAKDTIEASENKSSNNEKSVFIIGEPVFASSLKYTLTYEFGFTNVTVISPLEADPIFLSGDAYYIPYECDIREKLKDAGIVIADPLYRRILNKSVLTHFIDFPHEAYSGRIYREEIPVFIGEKLTKWLKDRLN